MNPALRPLSKVCAFTLAEMIVSLGIGSLILASLVFGAVGLQKTFVATDEYYKATSDQMRVLDYIAMDTRRAISGSVSNSGQTLTLTLPDYIDYSQNPPAPRTATIKVAGTASTLVYGSPGTQPTAVYTISGTSPNQTITRTYTPSSGAAKTTILTAASADYQFSCYDPANAGSTANFSFGGAGQPAMITAKVTFMPRFNRLNLPSARSGTTASMNMLLRNHK